MPIIRTQYGFHLNDLGNVIGAYTWYAAFTGKHLTTLQLGVIPGSFKLLDENKMVIAEAVNNAIKTPFEVTQSAHKN